MAETVLLPKIGITVESCLIGAWKKQVGDYVRAGDVLFSYETDKAVFDCESTAEGVLLEIFFGEGDEARVLAPVCVIGAQGEVGVGANAGAGMDAGSGAGADADDGAGVGSDACADAGVNAGVGAGSVVETGVDADFDNFDCESPTSSKKISPRAKNLAKSLGIDYNLAFPSGPHGRIIERDIEAMAGRSTAAICPAAPTNIDTTSTIATNIALESLNIARQPNENAGTTSVEYIDEKLPQIRRVIARTMQKSLSEMAQLTHHHSFDATGLVALRAEFKQFGSSCGLEGATIGDIILYVVVKILRDFPDFNAHLIDGETMRRFHSVNLGVAIDTPRGLMVPTIFNAGGMSLKQLSAHVKELAGAARSGSISPDLLSGGTFTVSNLGSTGIEMFTPIINPPQVAILGVCGLTTRVRESTAVGGGLSAYPSIGLSLTYDHRAVDGAPASKCVQKICESLEHIGMFLINEHQ